MNIAILFGGSSVEHEISILSAIQVMHAIDRTKYHVIPIYLTKDHRFLVGKNFHEMKTFKKKEVKGQEICFYSKQKKLRIKEIGFWSNKVDRQIDCILPVVHGKNIEDGVLAGFFNIFQVPYAGSDVFASSILQHKGWTKKALHDAKIPTVSGVSFTEREFQKDVFTVLEECNNIGFPLIIKPATLGSSIGIYIAKNQQELVDGINKALRYDDEILVEQKLERFREFNQAILGDIEEYELSHIEEVKHKDAWLTFDEKYTSSDTIRMMNVELEEELKDEIATYSKKVLETFHTRGVIRIDYLYDEEEKKLYVNEINTIPGSLAFYLYEEQISFPKLIDYMIKRAIKNQYLKNLKISSFESNVLMNNHLKTKK